MINWLDIDFACAFLVLVYNDPKFEVLQHTSYSPFAEDLAIIRLTGGFVEY